MTVYRCSGGILSDVNFDLGSKLANLNLTMQAENFPTLLLAAALPCFPTLRLPPYSPWQNYISPAPASCHWNIGILQGPSLSSYSLVSWF